MQTNTPAYSSGNATVLVVGATTIAMSASLALTAWEVFSPVLSIALSAII